MVIVVVIMAATGASVAVIVMVIMVVMIVILMAVVVVMMVIVVLVAVVVVMMVIMVLMAVIMVVVMVLFHLLHQVLHHGVRLLNDLQKLGPGKLAAGSRHNSRFWIVLTEQFHIRRNLFLIRHICTAQNDGPGVLNLIVKELSKVLHVHFALSGIYDSHSTVQDNIHIL